MKFNIYYCKNKNFSDKCFEALIKHRLLHHVNGEKLEVDCHFVPEIKGLSEARFNVMFYDKDETLSDDDRKYFTNANWLERFKLKKQFGLLLSQQQPLAFWAIIISIVAIAISLLGYLKCLPQ